MIKGVVIVNNHGKPRLVKFYQHVSSVASALRSADGAGPDGPSGPDSASASPRISEGDAQQAVIRRIFQQVARRPDSFCNYLEGSVPDWGDNVKLIYRHYATLYFVFAVDSQESDLGILDLIQVFVEALDKCFENVCELDLIFHSDKVHHVLDEIVMGGMVLETNIVHILQAISEQNKLHTASLKGTGINSAKSGIGSATDSIYDKFGDYIR